MVSTLILDPFNALSGHSVSITFPPGPEISLEQKITISVAPYVISVRN